MLEVKLCRICLGKNATERREHIGLVQELSLKFLNNAIMATLIASTMLTQSVLPYEKSCHHGLKNTGGRYGKYFGSLYGFL
ncbi:MAG: hypothetical protein LBB22_02305 [Treponema sp.]|nr:hypothetical protein [Treponema sp.]